MDIIVVGAGAWGSAFANICADSNNNVHLWSRNIKISEEINNNHSNNRYLPGFKFPKLVSGISADIKNIDFSIYDLIAYAVPTQMLRSVLSKINTDSNDITKIPMISLMKGLEQPTNLRVTDVIRSVIPNQLVGVLSGPNLALEVIEKHPSGAVLAVENYELSQTLAKNISTPYFIIDPSQDVIGCEIAGACKNVIALACGMASGCGFGDNAKAAIVTAGFQELIKINAAAGGREETMYSLAGLGDLVATSISPLSRNHRYGKFFAESESQEILSQVGGVVEAVPTVNAIIKMAEKCSTDVPVVKAISDALNGIIEPRVAIQRIVENSKNNKQR